MKPSHDWPTWKIEECCDILDSKRVPINSEERERRIGDVPYYGANGQQGYIDDFIFDEPLILVAEDGGRFDEFSTRSIAYRIAGKSWVNNHAHVLRARCGFSQDAIFYTIEHKDIQPFIVGGTRTKLNQSALRSITIQLPERELEQTKIAEILSIVDQAIEQTEALIAKQQRIKTGLMQDLLTRGIDKNGNLRSEETHEFKDSSLGRIPVEWDTRQFADITPNNAPIGYGIVQPGAYDYTGVRVAGIYTINSRFQEWYMSTKKIEQAYIRSRIRPGDVLLSIKGTTGRVGVVPEGTTGNISRDIARIRPIKEINPHYLRCLMLSDFFQRYLGNAEVGTTRAEISIKILRDLYVIKPPNSEQDEIVNRVGAIEQSIDQDNIACDKLRSLKTALMQDLLTGKVSVTPLLTEEECST